MKELVLTCNKIIVFTEIFKKYKTSPIYSEVDNFTMSVWTNQETLESVLDEFIKNLQYYRAIGTCELRKTE